MVNGVQFFGWSDGTSYSSQGVWQSTALAFEIHDLDPCYGHAANGNYHHHSYSPCLAERLGDKGGAHSPVYGFSLDGYPIHGPYNAGAGTAGLAVSCFSKRDYSSASSATGCGSAAKRTCTLKSIYDISLGTNTATYSGPDTTATLTTQSGNIISAASGVYYQDYYYNSS
jgi:hypothetical protein